MKKLLSILGVITLVGTGTTSVIGCSKKITNDDLADEQPTVAKDAMILNMIAKQVSSYLQEYASKQTLINEKDYQNTSFEKFHEMVSAEKENARIEINDPIVGKILQLIRSGFDAEFDNINRDIINIYTNYYQTDKPVVIQENAVQYTANFIDLEKLSKMTGIEVAGVKAVRLDFNFQFRVYFKNIQTIIPGVISYTLTNNVKVINDLLSNVINKVEKPIINYFDSIRSIKIDSDNDFKTLYDNFNIIFSNDYNELDKIITKKLKELVQNDKTLEQYKDKIVFIDSQQILNLVSAPITDTEAGNVAGSNAVFDLVAKNTTANWTGEGFNPEQLTGQNFLKFYRSIMPIFRTKKGILQLGSFNVNLLKIQVAGFPLSGGGVVSRKKKDLIVNVEISDNGLNTKLTNFGNIIAAFNKYYRIETYFSGKRSIFYVSTVIFDEIKKYFHSSGNLQKMWTILEDNFKSSSAAKGLPDLDLFYLDESYKALTANAKLYYIEGDDNVLYPSGSYTPGKIQSINPYWTFDYRFGINKNNSFIYSTYAGLRTTFGIMKWIKQF